MILFPAPSIQVIAPNGVMKSYLAITDLVAAGTYAASVSGVVVIYGDCTCASVPSTSPPYFCIGPRQITVADTSTNCASFAAKLIGGQIVASDGTIDRRHVPADDLAVLLALKFSIADADTIGNPPTLSDDGDGNPILTGVLKLNQGTTAEASAAPIPAGSLFVDTELMQLLLGDGTPGGLLLNDFGFPSGSMDGKCHSEGSSAADTAVPANVILWQWIWFTQRATTAVVEMRVGTGSATNAKVFINKRLPGRRVGVNVAASGDVSVNVSGALVTFTLTGDFYPGRYAVGVVFSGTPAIGCLGTLENAMGLTSNGTTNLAANRSLRTAHTFANAAPDNPTVVGDANATTPRLVITLS